ncbi:MAG: T9SS type A sorting domain-containing protein [Flavobacteriales bacterium]
MVYFGSVNQGLWHSTDAGNTWQQISAVQNGDADRGVRQVVFDASSEELDGKTSIIYVTVDGVYTSEDAGETWALTGAETFGGTAPHFYDAEISTTGVFFTTVIDGPTYISQGVWRCNGDWIQIYNDGFEYGEIAIDPFDENRLLLQSEGFTESKVSLNATTANPTFSSIGFTHQAESIPWLGWIEYEWFVQGECMFDRSTPNKLWKANGVGTWVDENFDNLEINWVEKSNGQEHLVANDIKALPDGKAIAVYWDRPVFYHEDLDEYPEIHQPSVRFNSAWDLSVSAEDPLYIVGVIEDHRFCCYDNETRNSGYSEDGGVTWTPFATQPGNGPNEQIWGVISVAAEDKDNIVWVPANGGFPYYTLDRGQTWTQADLPGASNDCCLNGFYWSRRLLTSDKTADNTFYMYDWGEGNIFKTTDGGVSWEKYSGVLSSYGFNAKITSVPEHEGHLLFSRGAEENMDFIHGLRLSEDGGQTWTEFENTTEVLNVAVGKAASEADYPTIFIQGRVGGVFGYFMSTDKGVSWESLGQYPVGIYDVAKVLEADMNIYGRLFVGFGGNGFVYHDLDSENSINNLSNLKDRINLYPNPTADKLTVSLKGINTEVSFEIVSDLGQVVKTGNLFKSSEVIQVSDLAKGVYTLILTSKEGTSRSRFIKQ